METIHKGVTILTDEAIDLDKYYLFLRNGYPCLRKKGTNYTAALPRVILGLKRGDGLVVDHISRDKLDNRRSNLRVATSSDNNCNAKTSNGKYRGVCYDKAHKKFRGYVQYKGKRYDSGWFFDLEEARIATDLLRKKIHGDYYLKDVSEPIKESRIWEVVG